MGKIKEIVRTAMSPKLLGAATLPLLAGLAIFYSLTGFKARDCRSHLARERATYIESTGTNSHTSAYLQRNGTRTYVTDVQRGLGLEPINCTIFQIDADDNGVPETELEIYTQGGSGEVFGTLREFGNTVSSIYSRDLVISRKPIRERQF